MQVNDFQGDDRIKCSVLFIHLLLFKMYVCSRVQSDSWCNNQGLTFLYDDNDGNYCLIDDFV